MIAKKALGLIETVGLAAAVEAADKAVKTANVELIGYELSKGAGMVTVKILGDVGAVNAAVSAAVLSGSSVSKVVSSKVIARPDVQIERIVLTKETVGMDQTDGNVEKEAEEKESPEKESQGKGDSLEAEEPPQMSESQREQAATESTDIRSNIMEIEEVKGQKKKNEICNLCKDPKCTRKKGEPKSHCIHEKNKNKLIAKEN